MNPIILESSGERFVLSIDKEYIDKEYLMQMLERIRTEHLAKKIDFGKDAEQLGEDIKADWWQKNKERFIGNDQ